MKKTYSFTLIEQLVVIAINDMHNGGTNSAYMDGHCDQHRYEFFMQPTTLGGTDVASRFWNHIQIGN